MKSIKYKSKIRDSTVVRTMTDQFAFLRDKRKPATITVAVAMSLSVLLLLPASLGFEGTIVQQAFAQFNLPLLEDQGTTDEETTTTDEGQDLTTEGGGTTTATTPATTPTNTTTTTTPTTTPTVPQEDLSTYLTADINTDALYGFIGATLPSQGSTGGGGLPASDGGDGHVANGRFRLFANDTSVRRFVAEMNLAAIDGSSIHNVTIRDGDPHRFEVTAAVNGVSPASSSIVGDIFLDGSPTPVIDNVPMTLSISGQSLAIQGIDIDETRLTDPGQRDILSPLNGNSVYGTIPR